MSRNNKDDGDLLCAVALVIVIAVVVVVAVLKPHEKPTTDFNAADPWGARG